MDYSQVKQLAKDSFFYSLPQILPSFANILLIPIYTTFLTPKDYGILAMLVVVSQIITIVFWLNMNTGVLRFYHDYEGKERKKFLGTIALGSLVHSFILCIFFVLAGNIFINIIFKSGDIPFYPFLLAQILIVFLGTAAIVPAAVLINERKAMQWSSIQLLSWSLTTGLTIYFIAALKEGAWGKIKSQLIVAVILFIIYWLITLKHIKVFFSWKNFFKNLIFGLPLLGKSLSAYLYQFSDRWILERSVSMSQIGLYSFADSFSQFVRIPHMSFTKAWMAHFYKEATQNIEAAKKMVREISYYWATLMVLLTLLFCLLSRTAILFLAHKNFHESTIFNSVILLSTAYFIGSLQIFSLYSLGFAKRNMPIFTTTLISALLNITINLFLIPRFGIIGAAWARVISYAINLILLYIASQAVIKISFHLLPLMKVILLGFATFWLASSFEFDNILISIAKNMVIFIIFVCLLFLFNLLDYSKFKNIILSFKRSKNF